METDIQQAIEAEKTFNDSNRYLLLVTFTEEVINTNTFKQLHRSVQDVHLLQPEFSPKCRYIIEVDDLFHIHTVRDVIMKHNFENRRVHVEFLQKFNDPNTNLDPYKLQVNNLPSTISPRELKQLYPLSTDCTFLLMESKSRSVLVHFSKVQDSITAYKTTNFMQYQSNILTVKFYRKDNNLYKRTQKKRSFTEDRDTDFWESSDEENINRNSTTGNDYTYKDTSNSDDDIKKWMDIQTNALKDKIISDTLLIHNLPINTTGNEMQNLFPNLYRYKFIPEQQTKSCIVRFRKVEDAVNMYKESNNIFKSNILQIDFYDKENDSSFYKKKLIKQEVNNAANIEDMFEIKDKNKSRNEQNEERIDRFALHVENLPLSTSNEDILQLFPDHLRYEIISVKNQNSASAHVYFKTAEDTLRAYNASNNILYKRNILSVKFKSKKFQKPNPFALMKRNTITSIENNCKKKKTHNSEMPKTINDDEVIIIEDTPSVQTLTEDDIEYDSEEEDQFKEDDDFFVSSKINGNNFLGEDYNNIRNDNDLQAVDLEDNIVSPLDQDDF